MDEQVRLRRTTASSIPRPGKLLAIAIAVIVVIGLLGYAGFTTIRSSQTKPIAFDAYSKAKLVSQKTLSPTSDTQTYNTTDSVQTVLNFYIQRYGEINDNQVQDNGCLLVYRDAVPSDAPGHSSGRCLYQDAFGDLTRTVTIKIDFQPDSAGSTTGKTVIVIERTWGG